MMIDLKKAKLDDFQLIKASRRETEAKARCTFYRVKPGTYTPKHTSHRITEMPKELYDEFFQKGV